jgi:hypothetical protein
VAEASGSQAVSSGQYRLRTVDSGHTVGRGQRAVGVGREQWEWAVDS